MSSTTERLKNVFGEVPNFAQLGKMTKADERKLKKINKDYDCKDGVIVTTKKLPSRTKGEKSKSPWIAFLKNFYADKKSKDPKYSYKQAMKDASIEYKKLKK
tara:strand:+ start:2129 stop:2434 length:306 start_codon:yes stop_codon:yes gene_type:complete